MIILDETELAVIKGVAFGTRDVSRAILSFAVHTKHGVALQCLSAAEAIELIERHQVTEVHKLEGKACLVTRPDRGTIKFVDLFEYKGG